MEPGVPIHAEELKRVDGDVTRSLQRMIDTTVDRMYAESDENRFLEVTYASGDKEVLYFKDFNSGAMIENIVTAPRRRPSSGSCPRARRG